MKRLAVVTGGTRGIGLAIAERLAEDGHEVVVTGRGSSLEADFSDRAQTERVAAALAKMPVDVLVNNAGINRISPFEEIRPADFDAVQEVNLRAPLLLCQAVLPGMRRREWGRIVNIASVFSRVSREQRAPYSASKFGLDGLTAALAAEVASQGVLANCVSPGFVDTDLTRSILGEAGIEEVRRAIPIRRLAQPREIAELVAWLAGEKNTYVSGQNLVIDGGFTRV